MLVEPVIILLLPHLANTIIQNLASHSNLRCLQCRQKKLYQENDLL